MNRFSGWPRKYLPELLTLTGYALLLGVVLCFHEPWYDEAQAWLIARDASWSDLLFVLPHYEGHPPVWYAFLALFARAGADFEWTMKLISFLINVGTVAFLLFRAPFPRWAKCALPFTYFLFYQHGVICRPYSLLFLGFLLAGHFWRTREAKPVRMALSLALLCASSAYGILFAGGIAAVWLLDARFSSPDWGTYFRSLFRGRRFWALAGLLAFALLQIALILPKSDTFAVSYGVNSGNPLWFRLLYMAFGALADATCFSAYTSYSELRYAHFSIPLFLAGCAVGALLFVGICVYGRKKRKLLLFVLPYGLFVGFSGVVYFYLQHIDVLLQFLVFWCWVCLADRPAGESFPVRGEGRAKCRAFSRLSSLAAAVCLGISLFWCAGACRNEILYPYGFSGALADYLDETGLASYGVTVCWKVDYGPDGEVYDDNTNQTVNGVALNAYYPQSVVPNMNGGNPHKTYVLHRIPTQDEVNAELARLRSLGLPAVTLDKPQLDLVFPELDDPFAAYTEVAVFPEVHLWKTGWEWTDHRLYVRTDLAEQMQLPKRVS